MSTAFVVALGMGTVFSGLIVIILLCKLMSFFVNLTESSTSTPEGVSSPSPVVQKVAETIQDKGAVVAAISAAVAEELGTDITNIRIHSIKRV